MLKNKEKPAKSLFFQIEHDSIILYHFQSFSITQNAIFGNKRYFLGPKRYQNATIPQNRRNPGKTGLPSTKNLSKSPQNPCTVVGGSERDLPQNTPSPSKTLGLGGGEEGYSTSKKSPKTLPTLHQREPAEATILVGICSTPKLRRKGIPSRTGVG